MNRQAVYVLKKHKHGLEQQVLEVKILHIYDIQEPRNTLNIKYTHYLDSK